MKSKPRAGGTDVLQRDVPVIEVELIRVEELTIQMENIWRQLRESNLQYSSPYYNIEFLRAVARVRKDVQIAVLRNSSREIIGFFPFQRTRRNHAEPVGGRLNDVHGILGQRGYQFEVREVLQQCGLSSFAFHAMANPPQDIDEFEFGKKDSHSIDMSDGWESYFDWARKNSVTIRKQSQKSRALEREHGPIRFEFDCLDPEALEDVIRLKRSKYVRTRTFDILSVKWASNLLRELHQVSSNNFQGMLSCMWAGDRLVAGHFGLLGGDVLHYWFPTFDVEFNRYSPGTELILRVCESAAQIGVKSVDFGYGDDPYKFKFCNASSQLSCGLVRFNRVAFLMAKQRFQIRNKLKRIPLKSGVKKMVRGLYPGFGQWNFK